MQTLKRNILAVPIVVWIGLLVEYLFLSCVKLLSRDSLGNIVVQFTLENYQRVFDPIYLRVFLTPAPCLTYRDTDTRGWLSSLYYLQLRAQETFLLSA